MKTSKKILLMLAAVLTAGAFTSQAADAQTIPVSEAQAFLGTWNLSVEGMPLKINITDQDGQVAADVEAVGMGPPQEVTTIARAEEALTLGFEADVGGQVAPINIRLTPDGETMTTAIDVAEGMYTASATATKS